MILLKSIKIKNKGSKISKTRAREGGASVFPFFLFPKAAAPVNLAIQQAGKKEGGAQIKKCEENFFAGWRASASGGGAERQFRSKKVRIW